MSCSKGEVITVNFGQQPFKYDIEGLLSEEKAAQAAAIERWAGDGARSSGRDS